jgi:hypothetical protein
VIVKMKAVRGVDRFKAARAKFLGVFARDKRGHRRVHVQKIDFF